MEIIKGATGGAWMIYIYGVPGVGKSTLCVNAAAPLYLDCEGGVARIQADKTPRINTMAELKDAINFAYKSDYQTIVFDTIDVVEEILRRQVLVDNGWKTLETPGFGKGGGVFYEYVADFLRGVEALKGRGKNVIWVGHDQIRTHAAPDTDAYDRYIPKLDKKIVGLFVGRCDGVFFCQHETIARSSKSDDERVRGIGTGKRIIRTTETPAWIAKNRFNLPATVDMNPEFFTLLK